MHDSPALPTIPHLLLSLLLLTGCGSASDALSRAAPESDGEGSAQLQLGQQHVAGTELRQTTSLRSKSPPFELLFEASLPPDAAFDGREPGPSASPLTLSVQLYVTEWSEVEFALWPSLMTLGEGSGPHATASLFVTDGTFDADAWPLPKRTVHDGTLRLEELRIEQDDAGRRWAAAARGVLQGRVSVPDSAGGESVERELRLEFEL